MNTPFTFFSLLQIDEVVESWHLVLACQAYEVGATVDYVGLALTQSTLLSDLHRVDG